MIVVEAERGEGGWDRKTGLVEVDTWRDDAGEALFVDQYHPRHLVSRALRRGCESGGR